MSVAGKIEQPYQHAAKLLRYEPIEPKGMCDNPVSIAPAGLVHCNLTDWSKFVAAHMSGYRGKSGLVSKSIFKKLHTSSEDSNYAMGWAIRKRNWAGGTVLTHSGSNTMNFAVVWIAPKKNMAFLACCNAGGSNSSVACDQAVSKMIQTYLE